MKMLIAAAALSLIAPMAMAQTTTPPTTNPQTTPPQATTPPSSAPMATPSGKQPQFYNHQPNEIRASKLIGTTVRNDANESVGDINEVVLSKDGKVDAVIIGVGGFLGIGEREVAINFNSLGMTTDDRGNTLVKLNVTKDALKAAPAWTWNTASGTGTTGAPPARKPANPQ
jgi:sporulation protein YlmC with PRC-barrel domain